MLQEVYSAARVFEVEEFLGDKERLEGEKSSQDGVLEVRCKCGNVGDGIEY